MPVVFGARYLLQPVTSVRPFYFTARRPVTSSVIDNFDDNTIDTSIWPDNYGTTSEVGGRARVACSSANYAGYQTDDLYRFDGIVIEVPTWPTRAGAVGECYFAVWFASTGQPAGTHAGFLVDYITGNIHFANRVGYTDAGAPTVPIDPVAHRWFWIELVGADLVWRTSPDGLTWTQRRTMTAPQWVTDSLDIRLLLESHRDAGTDDFVEFDNIGIPPEQGAPAAPAAEAAAGSGAAPGATVSISYARTQTFDGNTAGSTITTGNSAAGGDPFTFVSIAATATATYIADGYRGAAGRFSAGGTAGLVFAEQATGVNSTGSWFGRVRVRMPVLPADATGIRFAVVADSTGAFQIDARMVNTGKVELRTGAGVLVGTSTATYTAGQWVDVGLSIASFSATTGQIEMLLYDGTGAVAQTITSAANVDTLRSGGANKLQTGLIRSGISSFTVDIDDAAQSSTAYPSIPSAAVATEAAAEAAIGSGAAEQPAVGASPSVTPAAGAGTADAPSIAVATDAPAATGTGAAGQVSASLSPQSAASAGSGLAPDASASSSASADQAAGTGAALDATVSTLVVAQADAGEAVGAGSAPDGSVSTTASAPQATGSGTAPQPTAGASPQATLASGTGAAFDASVALTAQADLAAGSGAAPDATATTAAATQAPADIAAGIGSAPDASVWIDPQSATATGGGSAPGAASGIGPAAGTGSGSGAAAPASIDISASPEVAAAAGSAGDVFMSSAQGAPADVAVGAGLAPDPAVAAAVTAEVTAAAGSAAPATAVAGAVPPAATGSGAAFDASVLISAAPPSATGSGAAPDASAAVQISTDAAAGAGTAIQPLVLAVFGVFPGSADGAGAAFDASVQIVTLPDAAAAAGVAGQPSIGTVSSVIPHVTVEASPARIVSVESGRASSSTADLRRAVLVSAE